MFWGFPKVLFKSLFCLKIFGLMLELKWKGTMILVHLDLHTWRFLWPESFWTLSSTRRLYLEFTMRESLTIKSTQELWFSVVKSSFFLRPFNSALWLGVLSVVLWNYVLKNKDQPNDFCSCPVAVFFFVVLGDIYFSLWGDKTPFECFHPPSKNRLVNEDNIKAL